VEICLKFGLFPIQAKYGQSQINLHYNNQIIEDDIYIDKCITIVYFTIIRANL
jgi:hypothetical protein